MTSKRTSHRHQRRPGQHFAAGPGPKHCLLLSQKAVPASSSAGIPDCVSSASGVDSQANALPCSCTYGCLDGSAGIRPATRPDFRDARYRQRAGDQECRAQCPSKESQYPGGRSSRKPPALPIHCAEACAGLSAASMCSTPASGSPRRGRRRRHFPQTRNWHSGQRHDPCTAHTTLLRKCAVGFVHSGTCPETHFRGTSLPGHGLGDLPETARVRLEAHVRVALAGSAINSSTPAPPTTSVSGGAGCSRRLRR